MKKLFIVIFMSLNSIAFAQWTELHTTAKSLYSISSSDNNTAWAGCDSGFVLRTTNGGINWTRSRILAESPYIFGINDIYAFNSSTALVSTPLSYSTKVYKTTNGGNSWTEVFEQIIGYINAIWFTSPSNGIMVGNPVNNRWSIWKTFDGGSSWDSTGLKLLTPPSPNYEFGRSNCLFVNNLNNDIWFGASKSTVYFSSSNGQTWLPQVTGGDNDHGISAIWFNSANTGISGMTNGSLFMTKTNGNNWSPANVPGNAEVRGIIGVNERWWVVRDDKYIYNSNDNGVNWTSQYTAPAGNYTYITKSRNGSMLWAIKDNGSISKMDFATNISFNENQIPNSIILEQNYPNPFNPETQIKFSLPKQSKVSLKVFDVTGREVSTLINDAILNAGTVTQMFDGTGLQSGIYFYSLYVDGISLYTKKMILIK